MRKLIAALLIAMTAAGPAMALGHVPQAFACGYNLLRSTTLANGSGGVYLWQSQCGAGYHTETKSFTGVHFLKACLGFNGTTNDCYSLNATDINSTRDDDFGGGTYQGYGCYGVSCGWTAGYVGG